ncbi:calcium,calmodulin-dependent protein kinase, partial [Sarracenia purpurea var. burkii]
RSRNLPHLLPHSSEIDSTERDAASQRNQPRDQSKHEQRIERRVQVVRRDQMRAIRLTYRYSSVVSGDTSTYKTIDKGILADAADREYIDKEPKILHLLSVHSSILQIYRIL